MKISATSLAILFVLTAVSHNAIANVITFAGSGGAIEGSTVEAGFRYDEFSGGLWRQTNFAGNPLPAIEGEIAVGGGTLRVVRDDVIGGLFTFDQVEISVDAVPVSSIVPVKTITFTGLLNNVVLGVDLFDTSDIAQQYTTVSSSNLSSIMIDELRVTLPASFPPDSAANIDNLVLTPVPEPTTLALMGLGLAGLGYRRKRVKAA